MIVLRMVYKWFLPRDNIYLQYSSSSSLQPRHTSIIIIFLSPSCSFCSMFSFFSLTYIFFSFFCTSSYIQLHFTSTFSLSSPNSIFVYHLFLSPPKHSPPLYLEHSPPLYLDPLSIPSSFILPKPSSSSIFPSPEHSH